MSQDIVKILSIISLAVQASPRPNTEISDLLKVLGLVVVGFVIFAIAQAFEKNPANDYEPKMAGQPWVEPKKPSPPPPPRTLHPDTPRPVKWTTFEELQEKYFPQQPNRPPPPPPPPKFVKPTPQPPPPAPLPLNIITISKGKQSSPSPIHDTPAEPPIQDRLSQLIALRDSCLSLFAKKPIVNIPDIEIHPSKHFNSPTVHGHFESSHNCICFNEDYFDKVAPQEIADTMKHELLHAWIREHNFQGDRSHDDLYKAAAALLGIRWWEGLRES